MRWTVALVLCVFACRRSDPAHEADVEAWRKGRIERLKAPIGWLSLAGLHWLREGAQTAGSAEGNDVRLAPTAPPRLGTFDLRGETVKFTAAAEVSHDGAKVTEIVLQHAGKPTALTFGTFNLIVIKRGARFALRVRDAESKARREFRGIDSWPVDGRWRVTARFEPFAARTQIPVPTVLGTVEMMDSPGVVVFSLAGKELRLQPVLEEGEDLFFIFADETTGKDSYGAGRFLYAAPAREGKTVLDFNKAYNPPCAFTPYATCPLAPAQNKLAVAVRAGEKNYGH